MAARATKKLERSGRSKLVCSLMKRAHVQHAAVQYGKWKMLGSIASGEYVIQNAFQCSVKVPVSSCTLG